MTKLEISFCSLLFYKECTQIPISTNSNKKRRFSYMIFLAFSLPHPVQAELIGFLSIALLLGSEYKSVLLAGPSFPYLTVQCFWLHITHIHSSINIYT